MERLGTEIQKKRKSAALTLRALAAKIGVTSSFLSQIEKGKALPSLPTLKKLADALETTVSVLVAEEGKVKRSPVLRHTERKAVEDPLTDPATQVLTPPENWKMMEPMLFTFKKRTPASSIRYRHVGDEFAVVLKGSLRVILKEEEYLLERGDSIYFSSGIPHVFLNAIDGETEVLSINTPPNF
jgi:XRE family transcriptional regulator, regulator of sulfur utilization